MQLQTKNFGKLEIDEKGIIDFPEGVPGFESMKKFTILYKNEEDSLFRWLQCIDNPDLVFVIINPFLVKKDYDFEISDEVVKTLGIQSPKDVEVYSIVVVPDDTSKISMNLKAPVIINMAANKGTQIVLDTDRYSVRHYILEEIRKQEEAENVSSNEEKRAVYSSK